MIKYFDRIWLPQVLKNCKNENGQNYFSEMTTLHQYTALKYGSTQNNIQDWAMKEFAIKIVKIRKYLDSGVQKSSYLFYLYFQENLACYFCSNFLENVVEEEEKLTQNLST